MYMYMLSSQVALSTVHVLYASILTYRLLQEEGPEDVHASLTEVTSLTVVLVAQGNQVEQLQLHISRTCSIATTHKVTDTVKMYVSICNVNPHSVIQGV